MVKNILILAETSFGRIHRVSYELLNKGRQLAENGATVTCLVMADQCSDIHSLNHKGADTVYFMQDACFAVQEESLFKANAVAFIREHKPDVVFIGATHFGRSLAPRVAASLKTGLTADCTELSVDENGRLIQIRPAFSDNILAHIQTITLPQIATIRYKEFSEAEPDTTRAVRIIQMQPYTTTGLQTRILNTFQEDDTDIGSASVIVAAGRGVKRKEDLQLMETLATLLGGVVGVSRTLVEAGFMPSARQIGYSGHRVKPKLYIACGISGAAQHIAGMKESAKIIAINSDPSAPIFSLCDVGMVGDLYHILPKMIDAVKRSKSNGKEVYDAANSY